MTVCSNPACGADTTDMSWCRSCGSEVGISKQSTEIRHDSPPAGGVRSRALLAGLVALAAVVVVVGGVAVAANTGPSGQGIEDAVLVAPPVDEEPSEGVEARPQVVAEAPQEPAARATATPQPPAGQSWEPVEGRPDLLKTSVTSEAMAALIADQFASGSIGSSGAWLTSPANGQQYLISCTPQEAPRATHVSCVEIDNEDGGQLDAGIVVLS